MSPEVILGLIVFLPVIVLMLLRINAALVFLSLCLGNVLVLFVAPNTGEYLSNLAKYGVEATAPPNNTVRIALLLIPAILTAIFMIRTVNGRSRLLLNALPALGVGLLAALLVVPLMTPGLQFNVVNSDLWAEVQKFQDAIVGISAVVCLFVLWLQRPKTGEKHGKHHKG